MPQDLPAPYAPIVGWPRDVADPEGKPVVPAATVELLADGLRRRPLPRRAERRHLVAESGANHRACRKDDGTVDRSAAEGRHRTGIAFYPSVRRGVALCRRDDAMSARTQAATSPRT
jgi:hypothetical protein